MKFHDFAFALIIGSFIMIGVGFVVYIVPNQFKADRLCLENGYPHSKIYTDGSIFCSRKGDMGKDEIVRIN